jgi:serine/threonine protein kinase
MLSPGTQLGPYRIEALVGEGGMGQVYRATDTRLDRRVAVKVLPPQFAQDPDRLTRFEREAKAVAALAHPNILVLYDIGTDAAGPYVVTELLDGETLRQRLKTGPLPYRRAVEIARSIAEGLAAAHARGVIHRDVKPENLFLTRDGRVKILDFGVAHFTRPQPAPAATDDGAPTAPTVTAPGVPVGTPHYMSPEQVRGQAVDARTDLFALGCVLYEMLSGRRLFAKSTSAETLSSVLTDEVPPLAGTASAVPDKLDRLLQRCLAKESEARFQSAADLAYALVDLLETPASALQPAASRPSSATGSQRQWLWTAGVAVALLIVMALLMRPRAPDGSNLAASIESIAVLPLRNLSGDVSKDYHGDGMTDLLITELGQLGVFRKVSGFASVMQFKGTNLPLPEIARRLDVEALVEGSFDLMEDQRIHVNARLVHAKTEAQLWSQLFQRDFKDLPMLKGDIARTIAGQIRSQLDTKTEPRSSPGTDMVAYDLCLQGRYHFGLYSALAVERARECFEKALERDKECYLALAGLADYYGAQAYWGWQRPDTVSDTLQAYVNRIALIDPKHSMTARMQGNNAYYIHYDWPKAMAHFEEALRRNPSATDALLSYAFCLGTLGQNEKALAQARESVRVDPLNSVAMILEFIFIRETGHLEEAIQRYEDLLLRAPNIAPAYYDLWPTYALAGRPADALRTCRKYLESRPNDAGVLPLLKGIVSDSSGYQEKMLAAAEWLAKESEQRYVHHILIATFYLQAGRHSEAIDWLERAKALGEPQVVHVNTVLWSPLQRDARFLAFLRDLNIPTE